MPDQAHPMALFEDLVDAPEEEDATRRLPEATPNAAQQISSASSEVPPAPAGLGALMRHAWPLIATLGRLERGARARDVELFKRAMTERIGAFEQNALTAGLDPRQVAAARYTLCTAIDEAVSTSSWGARSGWAQESLLSVFYGETWGGEKVFALIDRALTDPRRTTDLIELFSFVLALGFEGKFRLAREGNSALEALRERLFDAAGRHFGAPTPVPSPARQAMPRRAGLVRYAPVWTVAVVFLLISLLVFGWFDYELKGRASVIAHHFDQVAAVAAGGNAR